MFAHKFSIGERVQYRDSRKSAEMTSGDLTVSRQMSADERGYRYRIDERGGRQLIVHESELAHRVRFPHPAWAR